MHRHTRHRPQHSTQRKPNKLFGKTIDPQIFVNRAAVQVEEVQTIINTTFSQFAIQDVLKKTITAKGYYNPTPIQEQSIPYILAGQDIIGIANTGTGKTAAFLIPILNKILLNRSERAVILVPTRELALQIFDECRSLSHGMNIYAAVCIGGTSIHSQEQLLRRNPNIVIGTPGRIKDLIGRHTLNFSHFQTFVLDEVDHMVDIGFIHDIRYLMTFLPPRRQSLFFSATLPDEATQILHQFVKDPVTVSVKKRDTSANIDQDVVHVPKDAKKIDILHDLLVRKEFQKVLVFGRTKWGIEKLTKELIKRGVLAASIHGNKTQNQRQRALDAFKKNEINVLLATDVASRGIDISDVTHVINYDLPATYDDYVHRIGRTGRAEKKGIALTFIE